MVSDPSVPTTPDDRDADELVDAAVRQVGSWLERADAASTADDRRTAERLQGVVTDEAGVRFAMRFVDRVIRPERDDVAADQLVGLVGSGRLPSFLSPVDRLLLRAGARLAPRLPGVVMPLARARMRGLVGHLVADADTEALAEHLAERRAEGFRLNVNLLGEAVLGRREADRRHREALDLLAQPDVDYVSVKLSSVAARLEHWDHEGSVDELVERLRPLLAEAGRSDPPTFVNLDMEEYHDLDLTVDVFTRALDEPAFRDLDAGIVLQAYLPDSFPVLQRLVAWADARDGGDVKIRLVKGANLAMEQVEAATRNWEQAPYPTKADTDANYKRCLDWVLRPERLRRVRIGVASHNLFDVAFARLLAERRGVADRVEFEMLQGMAAAEARVVRDDAGGVLLYTPAVRDADFDVAISYLFRRLEENAADQNFIRHLFDLRPGTAAFESEEAKFRRAVAERGDVSTGPRRSAAPVRPASFENEPDADPSLPETRRWAEAVTASLPADGPSAAIVEDPAEIDRRLATAVEAQRAWSSLPPSDRRALLWAVADELARRRGDLVAAMITEGRKTFGQADVEVSEAIDFARYYGDRALELSSPSAEFRPFGVVAVVPPWNFPVAIPAGGALAALAAGNAAILKPAPEVPRCSEIVVECAHAAGVPADVLQLVRTRDDDVGRHLVTHAAIDAVVLTGAYETAELFRSWRPDLRILAETSGKNALVVTPNADLDEAVADLVDSAFGHAGQKCSAASLVICVGGVERVDRFRRQLVDAVSSLRVGPPEQLGSSVGPTIAEPTGKLERALTRLEPGESWLVAPRRLGPALWRPGVREGVAPGSWFHRTECFGPVLGIMVARDLDEALAIQNGVDFGLTGGIHSLDPDEIEYWLERVEVGNAYVNRVITGAIVQRQPFGGWKRSSVGPGAKAGGPDYVASLGTWEAGPGPRDEAWLAEAERSDARAWAEQFGIDHDPTGLFCEANVLRYRPRPGVVVRRSLDADPVEFERVRRAAARSGSPTIVSDAADEPAAHLAGRLASLGVDRLRVIGSVEPLLAQVARAHGIHVADDPVTADGRLELRHHLREQAISRTLHRHGNLLADARR